MRAIQVTIVLAALLAAAAAAPQRQYHPSDFSRPPSYSLYEGDESEELELSWWQRLVRPWTWFSGFFGGDEEEEEPFGYQPYRPYPGQEVARLDRFAPGPQGQQQYRPRPQFRPSAAEYAPQTSRSDAGYAGEQQFAPEEQYDAMPAHDMADSPVAHQPAAAAATDA